MNHRNDGAGHRDSCEGREVDGGEGRWRQYPLVVESGPTTFAGAVNASVSPGGGESER